MGGSTQEPIGLNHMNDNIIRSIAKYDIRTYGKLSQVNKAFNLALSDIKDSMKKQFPIRYARLINLTGNVDIKNLSKLGKPGDVICKKTGSDKVYLLIDERGKLQPITPKMGYVHIKIRLYFPNSPFVPVHMGYWNRCFPDSLILFDTYYDSLQASIYNSLAPTEIQDIFGRYLWTTIISLNGVEYGLYWYLPFASFSDLDSWERQRTYSLFNVPIRVYMDTRKDIPNNGINIIWVLPHDPALFGSTWEIAY